LKRFPVALQPLTVDIRCSDGAFFDDCPLPHIYAS